MEQHRIGGLPSQLIDRYLMTVEAMIDGAREEGRLGYLRAARQPHRQTWWFRFIGILYSYLGLSRPLAAYLARRLQTLLITRIILLELTVFLEFRLHGLFGERPAELLGDILRQRLTEVARHLYALRLQHPSYARELDHQLQLGRASCRERMGTNEYI